MTKANNRKQEPNHKWKFNKIAIESVDETKLRSGLAIPQYQYRKGKPPREADRQNANLTKYEPKRREAGKATYNFG